MTDTAAPPLAEEPDENAPEYEPVPDEADDALMPEEEQHDEEQTTSPAPEASGPQSAADIDKLYAKLAASAKTWRNRVRTIMGDDADELVACELCEQDIPGFHWPAAIMTATDPVQGALIEALRLLGEDGMRQDPENARCEFCNGVGEVLTGSRKPGYETKSCPQCSGAGYTGPGNAAYIAPLTSVPAESGDQPVRTPEMERALRAMQSVPTPHVA